MTAARDELSLALWYPASAHGTQQRLRQELDRLRLKAAPVQLIEFFDVDPADLDAAHIDTLAPCQGLIALADPSPHLNVLPQLTWLQTITTGIDHLQLEPLRSAGIRVSTAAETSGPEIAEFVMARILEHYKRLGTIAAAQEQRRWVSLYGRPLSGSHAVLFGFGPINREIARLLSAFGVQITAVRRHAGGEAHPAHRVVGFDQVDQVLSQADLVISALPAVPDTDGLFDAALFTRMRRGTWFCNVGRGNAVVEQDLLAALDSGHLVGAALDVTEVEPLPTDSPLWSSSVRLSAHCSSSPPRALERVFDVVIENVLRLRRGEALRNEVNLATD